MIFAVDFDGTCVTHEFPKVGRDIGAAPVLKELVANGHQLILWTMRSNVETPSSDDPNIINEPGNYLDDAVDWFNKNGIKLWGINENPDQKCWTQSPKAYAQMYIDDAALGAPLKMGSENEKAFVDWNLINSYFIATGILKET